MLRLFGSTQIRDVVVSATHLFGPMKIQDSFLYTLKTTGSNVPRRCPLGSIRLKFGSMNTQKSVNLLRNMTQSWVNLSSVNLPRNMIQSWVNLSLFVKSAENLTNSRSLLTRNWVRPRWTLFWVTLTQVFAECTIFPDYIEFCCAFPRRRKK